jgi:hypothetical protein
MKMKVEREYPYLIPLLVEKGFNGEPLIRMKQTVDFIIFII